MHYRAISNTGSHFEVFESERFTLVCFRILMAIQLVIKESWVCGFVFYYIYFNKIVSLNSQVMFFFL